VNGFQHCLDQERRVKFTKRRDKQRIAAGRQLGSMADPEERLDGAKPFSVLVEQLKLTAGLSHCAANLPEHSTIFESVYCLDENGCARGGTADFLVAAANRFALFAGNSATRCVARTSRMVSPARESWSNRNESDRASQMD
jgi:hypothetical protein